MNKSKITHSYQGLGMEYLKARKGSPVFAQFIVSHTGFDKKTESRLLTLVELGVGSGQQTEFVEKELRAKGITDYKILAYDKSTDQLKALKTRMDTGEISKKVTPEHLDFDADSLPLDSESVDVVCMAHVLHHIVNKEKVFSEIVRVMRIGARLFILGVTLEDMKDHPLDEFFPTKYEYEIDRYPPEKQLIKMFESAGLTYEKPFRVGSHNIRSIDRDFLRSVENTTIDSVLKIMGDADPPAFNEGVARVRKEVEQSEKTGEYRIYHSAGRLRVFWGIKK